MGSTVPSGSADIAHFPAICAGMLGSTAGISMRELDPPPTTLPTCAVVGAGRMGTAIAAGLRTAGPLRRDEAIPADAEVVLLAVPDGQIAAAAAKVPEGPLLGHCSGATGLDVFAGREGFSLHPLMSVPTGGGPELFSGAGAAIDGTTPRALDTARTLALALGMDPAHVEPRDRVAYHAAAAMASNFLVALEGVAERLAATAGISREQIAPLVLATARQWAETGAQRALTGPIVRGDEETVARHRATIAERMPDILPLWDALADATRALAANGKVPV
jgi:predicted short-subunit dehydrogenase-like oxidoreductase (DUF2520 family)